MQPEKPNIAQCTAESNAFVLLGRLTYSMFPQNTVNVDRIVREKKNVNSNVKCTMKGFSLLPFLEYPQCRF